MRNRVVMYSVAGVVAMGLIAAAAFKSRQQSASDSAAVAPVAAPHPTTAKHPVAKVVHPVVRTAPVVAVAESDAAGPLPKSYRVLLTHCLFSAKPTVASGQAASPAEAELTLRGVCQSGRAYVACVENTVSHQSQEVNLGEAVGLGKIVAMDLNGVGYATSGKNIRIEVGQTFRGARKVATAETSSISTFRQITE